jgi:hypothetical protein
MRSEDKSRGSLLPDSSNVRESPNRTTEITSKEENEMDTNNSLLKRAFLTFLPVLLVTFLAVLIVTFSVSCGFGPCPFPSFNICDKFEELPLTTVVLSTPTVGFENPGTIKVIHGSGTATLDHGDFIKVEQSLEIPKYANKATVFLNGWKSSYWVMTTNILQALEP